MPDKIKGFLEVGCNEQDEIVVNQARQFARNLIKHAEESERSAANKREQERLKNIPPVDRTKRCTTSGNPETDDHRELLPNGQQKDYIVLCHTERAKGFVRPVRRTYRHKPCNSTTTMGLALAETYARDPTFYSGTFCCNCAAHFPLDQFVWEGTNEILGS